ncbi:hypothetical protein F9B85_03170 [Heliorestis acidaminivorans]|uniref:Uncharacterized protein n=1 Tax=Heliorestis acidaminivorans TaxID=553427 RepID=A0A6I0EYQ8_9FIRM|nr:DUF6470 family protein [Heliorestis acidaminivorans]KAB2953636.1 hypothetical protein F9B85_03170 [Heliorestis acidaminivorans]
MVQLHINQQYGKINLSIQKPEFRLSIRHPQLQLKIAEPRLQMQQSEGQLEIDQYPSRASLGLKNRTDALKDYAQAGRKAALEGAARRAQEGNALMRIEHGGNPIASIAKNNSEDPPVDINIGYLERPNIRYRKGELRVQANNGKVEGHFAPGQVQGQHQWGSVRAYLEQKPSIRFWTTGSVINRQL